MEKENGCRLVTAKSLGLFLTVRVSSGKEQKTNQSNPTCKGNQIKRKIELRIYFVVVERRLEGVGKKKVYKPVF